MSDPTQAAHDTEGKFVEMPRPTAWPFAMAIGTALTFSGLLTNASVSVLGAILTLCGAVGWFRQVLPHEQHELVPVRPEEAAVPLPKRPVKRLVPAAQIQRAWLPFELIPLVAGIKGGLAGGVVMAVLASVYGIAMYHSMWYPINLLAGSFTRPRQRPQWRRCCISGWAGFCLPLRMHITCACLWDFSTARCFRCCLRVLLFWADRLAHCFGPACSITSSDIVNPLLDYRINWWWFAVSQVGLRRRCRLGGRAPEQGPHRRKHASGASRRDRSSRPDARARRRGQAMMRARLPFFAFCWRRC